MIIDDTRALLSSNGIEYEIITYEADELERRGYIKLPHDVFERVSMSLQSMPGQLAVQATEEIAKGSTEQLTKNAYRLVLKEGMHLGKSNSMSGAFKGLAFYDSNNKLAAHADWVPILSDKSAVINGPQLVLGVFNVMSIATGQYYLSRINGKLSAIETGINDIIEYLEVEKSSEIIASDKILMDIFRNLQFIMESDFARQTTSIELKRIKTESFKNVTLLKAKIEATSKQIRLTEKSESEDLNKAFSKLEKDIPQYWCSVRSYINAIILDTVISEMDSPQYLDNVKSDLEEIVKQYNATNKAVDKRIDLFIKKANDLNMKKKLPKWFNNIVDCIPACNLWGLGLKLAGKGIIVIDKKIEDDSKKMKEKAVKKRLNP